MSPKAMNYKANSIIYFQGDKSEKIYILQKGKVSLNSIDIETNQEIHDLIKMGEFFGVKSSMGKYPREETAVVLTDSDVLVFDVPEFEQLAIKNTRIIMKMLKVFSNQLRRIHKQVGNLLNTGKGNIDPETGLYSIGEYYYKNNKPVPALHAFKRYLIYYPSGKYSQKANEYMMGLEDSIQTGSAPVVNFTNEIAEEAKPAVNTVDDSTQEFYSAVNLFSQGKYDEALAEFKNIISTGQEDEYKAKAYYELGRCFFNLQKYDECVQHFTLMIRNYPRHAELNEVLYLIGTCHERMGNADKAKGFYNKLLSMAAKGSDVYIKTKRALREME